MFPLRVRPNKRERLRTGPKSSREQNKRGTAIYSRREIRGDIHCNVISMLDCILPRNLHRVSVGQERGPASLTTL